MRSYITQRDVQAEQQANAQATLPGQPQAVRARQRDARARALRAAHWHNDGGRAYRVLHTIKIN